MVEFNNPPTRWSTLSDRPSDFIDGKIDWDEVTNKPATFPSNGTAETSANGFYSRETTELQANANSSQMLRTLTGMGANWISERVWLCRKNDGTNWLTVVIHNGVTVDASFLNPRNDTRTWWDRDIASGSHSWGNGQNSFLSIGENGFFRIHGTLPTSAAGLPSGAVWRDSNGFLRIV